MMTTTPINRLLPVVIGAGLCLLVQFTYAQQSKTVIGPTNPELAQGADELLAGNGEEGVRLTLLGLRHATRKANRLTAISNLCAGYILLDQFDTALTYCNQALEENDQHWRAYNNRALIYIRQERYLEAEQDILRGQELAPNSRTLKVVRAMLLGKTDPVSPIIIIDERRKPTFYDNDK
jgi:tetratricopeptide (TPR) repeat protein